MNPGENCTEAASSSQFVTCLREIKNNRSLNYFHALKSLVGMYFVIFIKKNSVYKKISKLG